MLTNIHIHVYHITLYLYRINDVDKKISINTSTISQHVRSNRKRVRAANYFACAGRCGKKGCEYTTHTCYDLNKHLKIGFVQCPLCPERNPTPPGNMYKHFRRVHTHLCNDNGGCPEHGIPDKSPRNKYDAAWFIAHGLSEIEADHFTWLKTKISASERNDERAKRTSKRLNRDQIDHVARQLLLEFQRRNYLVRGDDAGGHVRLEFGRHVWGQLSLDRVDNTLPHFIRDDDGNVPDVMVNIGFVILGINTRASLYSLYGRETCRVLRLKREETCTTNDQHAFLDIHKKTYTAGKKQLPLYSTCMSALFHDKKRSHRWSAQDAATVSSTTTKELYNHAKELYAAQKGRCYVSGIPLTAERGPWQASLERVDVHRPHLPGNLRLICACFNCVDLTSQKNYKHDDDSETSCGWTPARFRAYVGLP